MEPVLDVPPTRAEWVDGLLRRAILRGELAPGEKLRAEQLAKQWGVSATPVRETFQRLAGEGLVLMEPQRGARVAPISVGVAIEIYELRLLLDPAALRRSLDAAGRDPAFVKEVQRAHRALAGRHRTLAEAQEAHRAFHLALVSRCPNARLLREVASLLEQSQRFHLVGHRTSRQGDPAEEHRALVAAVVAGDATQAVRVLTAHLHGTLDAVRTAAA